ncbi:alpha-2-macroglobulin family protein [Motilimonas sp. KMU-193]|uniref:alpha-2-macroglobulin family protein n=1 Tax=Motilimonas sp. KMU-193 TaxID=3388668 RepID=UPI00396B354F
MTAPLKVLLLCLLTFISLMVQAAKLDYVGSYTHLGKPAIIVEFDPNDAVKPEQLALYLLGEDTPLAITWFYNSLSTALITTDVEAGQRYVVKSHDEKQSFSQQVDIAEIQPSVKLLGNGPFVLASGSRTLPVSTVNLDKVAVEILAVKQPAELLKQFYYPEQVSTWQMDQLAKYLEPVTGLQFDLAKGQVNQTQQANLRIPDEIKPGWYVLAIRGVGQFSSEHVTLAQLLLTDIGLQAKVFPNQLSIEAVDLTSQKALSQGEVSLLRKGGKRLKLGALTSGSGQFDVAVQGGDVLLVESSAGIGYLPLREVPLDLSDFNVTGRDYQSVEVFTYSNRDLFKPGETVPLNMVLRDADGEALNQQQLFLELVKPDGKVITSALATEQAIGFFSHEFMIPASAPLGRWSVLVKSNKAAKHALATFSFLVSEFVPERMDLNVDLGQGSVATPLFIAQQNIKVKTEGHYLFGAPASGNELKLDVRYQSVNKLAGPYQDYYVGEAFRVDPYADVPELPKVNLDETGQAQFDLPVMPVAKLQSPVQALINFELLETGGASISRKQQALLWQDKPLPGVRVNSAAVTSYSAVDFTLANISADGQTLLAGELTYKLERNRGGYYWTYSESYGWDLLRDSEWRPVTMDKLSLAQGEPAQISLNVEWGDYRLRVVNAEGVTTLYPFYAGWREGGEQLPAKPDHLTLTLDKSAYQNGDDISVDVSSEVDGELVLALEAGKVIHQQKLTIKDGKAKALVSIPANLKRHDLYLTATQVVTEQAMPRRLFSIVPIKLDRTKRLAKVTINAPEQLQPLTEAVFTVSAPELAGQQAWFTLSLMDLGITQLSRYQVPQIHDWFFAQRRYGADVIDLYSRQYLQRPDSFAVHRYGGDMAANAHLGDLVEAKTITIMSDLVALDEQGNGQITVSLPDYNGAAQVVATVFGKRTFGQAEQEVKIKAPVIAELTVPHFIAPNDETQVLMEVFNQSGETLTINAELSASEGVVLSGETQLSVQLNDGERRHLPVQVKALQGQNAAQFSLNLASEVYNQSRSWHVPVRAPEPILIHQLGKTLQPGESLWLSEQVAWPGMIPLTGQAGWLSFGHSPTLNLGQYAQNLFAYPYGCAEQTTSRAMPWTFDDASLTPFKAPLLEKASQQQILAQAVHRLSGMQKADGSFAMWNKHGDTQAWLSAYVTDFLIQAQIADAAVVPEEMLANSESYLRNLLNSQGPAAFYSAWLLARKGQIAVSDLWRLEQQKINTPLDAGHLGAAFLLAGDEAKGQQYLLQANTLSRAELEWSQFDYGSQIRDRAQVVAILGQLSSRITLAPVLVTLRNQLAEKVVEQAQASRYLSTQEKIALISAGISLRQGNNTPVSLQLDGLTVTGEGQGGSPIWPELVIENKGNEPIYLMASARGSADPSQPLTSTIKVRQFKRDIFTSNGKPLALDEQGQAKVKVGDKLIVVLRINLDEYLPSGLLVEHIPTGLVLEDPQFTNSGALISSILDEHDNSKADTLEYRQDRFVAALPQLDGHQTLTLAYVLRVQSKGQGRMPASFVEDMYQPTRFIYQASDVKSLVIE